MAAEETVKVGADLVALALLQVVALRAASLEEVGTLLVVTCDGLSVSGVSVVPRRQLHRPGDRGRVAESANHAEDHGPAPVPARCPLMSPLPICVSCASIAKLLSEHAGSGKASIPSEKLSLPIVKY